MSAVNIPGETVASTALKADIFRMIKLMENAQAPGCQFKVIDTQFKSMDNETVMEDWIVESCGKKIIYPVKMTPDPKGEQPLA